MMQQIGAIFTIRGTSNSPAEQHILNAHRANALDVIRILRGQGIESVIVAAPETDWLPDDLPVIRDDDAPDQSFHFGERLARLIEQHPTQALLHFGGGSAPLIDRATMGMLLGLLEKSLRQDGSIPTHIALTNNLHSSDWIAISQVQDALPIIRRADRDNGLALSFKESDQFEVRVLASLRPATSMDIDSLSDLAILAQHPGLQPELRHVIEAAWSDLQPIPIPQLLAILRDPSKRVLIVGRVSSLAWNTLQRAAKCQIEVITESVDYSIVKTWMGKSGDPAWAVQQLDALCHAVIWDNRPFLTSIGASPEPHELLASDARSLEPITDPTLHDFLCVPDTGLVLVTGGESLVTGGLYALAEILQSVPND
jgi:hypothetical protein